MSGQREMPMVVGTDGTPVPSMLIRMRCESCGFDHRILVGSDVPLGALPDIAKRTMRCNCKRHIPTITKMNKSLMSINGIAFRKLKGMPMFDGAKET